MTKNICVSDVVPLTTIDYPGELAAVLFCQGCPWQCRYCYNTELIPAAKTCKYPWQKIIDFLHRRQGILDAVVFSGGEPLAQTSLAAAIAEVKALGFKIGLHTGGPYPRRLEQVLPLVDWVGFDVKTITTEYANVTQVKNSGKKAFES